MADNPDMTLAVEFFTEAVEIPKETAKHGRPIFEDREFIRIAFPGDNKRELVAPAHEMHFVSHARKQMTYAERFPANYAAFKDGLAGAAVGTPLSVAPFLTPARQSELKALKITTVEQLAGLPDSILPKLGMGARDLMEKAKAYLAVASETAEVSALRRELAELKAAMSAPKAEPQTGGAFDGFDRDDLFNMATDAGLEPRSNASRDSLIAMLTEAAAKKKAA